MNQQQNQEKKQHDTAVAVEGKEKALVAEEKASTSWKPTDATVRPWESEAVPQAKKPVAEAEAEAWVKEPVAAADVNLDRLGRSLSELYIAEQRKGTVAFYYYNEDGTNVPVGKRVKVTISLQEDGKDS